MVNTKNLVVKSSLVSSTLIALLATSPLALAESATNNTTGAGSENTATTEVSNETNISSNNEANIVNSIKITANTGGNKANKNTGDGIITTGDINGSLTINNNVNSSNINPPACCDNSAASGSSNSQTGADSSNHSSVEVNNSLNISQNSVMNIRNNADVNLNTGNNEASKNTGDGIITTGDINFTIGIGNTGNNNNVGGNPETPNDPDEPNNPPGPPGSTLGDNVGGLPVTGSSLPVLPILITLGVGLILRNSEGKLRSRFLA